jgi:hypothetical protein
MATGLWNARDSGSRCGSSGDSGEIRFNFRRGIAGCGRRASASAGTSDGRDAGWAADADASWSETAAGRNARGAGNYSSDQADACAWYAGCARDCSDDSGTSDHASSGYLDTGHSACNYSPTGDCAACHDSSSGDNHSTARYYAAAAIALGSLWFPRSQNRDLGHPTLR